MPFPLCLYQAVAKMVQECYKYVDAVTDLNIKLRLIDTLRTVTAGKVCQKIYIYLFISNQHF